ncbi:MAG TPA: glycoside hydrolase family 15 protein [Nevskia sp.]|nr:glycoside hydrolase family 15 protein [Nevskia sp.]
MSETLAQWLDREYRHAAQAMLRSVSATGMVQRRPGFGTEVRAARGSVIASPVLGAYDPDPDYFFHWYRDSAVVMEALRLLYADGTLGAEALAHFGDFLRFNLALRELDGRKLAADHSWREGAQADFKRFLREDADLARVHGDAVAAETRVNPDGTLDISKWARPQHDGPPLRALAVLGWLLHTPLDASATADAEALLRADLGFTRRHWREPSYDIWEEEQGHHYYTLRVSAAALAGGADWLEAKGQRPEAQACRDEAAAILRQLDEYWLSEAGYYRSRVLESGARSAKELDIAVILAAIHIGESGGAHSVHDPRMQATLQRLERLFDPLYAINRERAPHNSPAMGRYHGDVYYSGGAYYFSTLGAAEFCFLAAQGAADAQAWIARGDGYLETVRSHTPADGELSEQFDQNDGRQTSARQLAWSYAAFISCVTARRRAVLRH